MYMTAFCILFCPHYPSSSVRDSQISWTASFYADKYKNIAWWEHSTDVNKQILLQDMCGFPEACFLFHLSLKDLDEKIFKDS